MCSLAESPRKKEKQRAAMTSKLEGLSRAAFGILLVATAISGLVFGAGLAVWWRIIFGN